MGWQDDGKSAFRALSAVIRRKDILPQLGADRAGPLTYNHTKAIGDLGAVWISITF